MIRLLSRFGALTLFGFLTPLCAAQAGGYSVLYAFQGGSDGDQPQGNLLLDKSGNLYGTTFSGGSNCSNGGCGTIFELAPGGTETVLTPAGGILGINFNGGLNMDAKGDLYGTAQVGGDEVGTTCPKKFEDGCGTAFELAPDGNFTWVYVFANFGYPNDGYDPGTGLLKAAGGYQYGTTTLGGVGPCHDAHDNPGCGTVYKVNGKGAETVLYSFQGDPDGATPSGIPIADRAGNLYGVTETGGAYNNGTVYKLAPDGTETVLYSFTGGSDGASPQSNLVLDSAGNLYGTAMQGGGGGYGTVFELAPDGTFTVVYAFSGGWDGRYPWFSLLRDPKGNLYGVTEYGGISNCSVAGMTTGCGVVYEINPRGVEASLHIFSGGSDGQFPTSLIAGHGGIFYGTTSEGGGGSCNSGTGCGTVFQVEQFP